MTELRPRVSVIIVNYNISDHVLACIRSVAAVRSGVSSEIIVIDNASVQEDRERLEQGLRREAIPGITVAYQETNLGFGKACNLGARMAQAEFLCFLNPDAILTEDVFPVLIEQLVRDPRIGLLGIRQKWDDGESPFTFSLFPTAAREWWEVLFLGTLYDSVRKPRLSSGAEMDVDWISGAFMMTPKKVFDAVGGFDERYFMYYEDIDLCRRYHLHGYRVIINAGLSFRHATSVSSRKNYRHFTSIVYSSKFIYLRKNFTGAALYSVMITYYLQVLMQLVLWSVLLPFTRTKSLQKIEGFTDVVRKTVRDLVR